jgi:hypothetical protein
MNIVVSSLTEQKSRAIDAGMPTDRHGVSTLTTPQRLMHTELTRVPVRHFSNGWIPSVRRVHRGRVQRLSQRQTWHREHRTALSRQTRPLRRQQTRHSVWRSRAHFTYCWRHRGQTLTPASVAWTSARPTLLSSMRHLGLTDRHTAQRLSSYEPASVECPRLRHFFHPCSNVPTTMCTTSCTCVSKFL